MRQQATHKTARNAEKAIDAFLAQNDFENPVIMAQIDSCDGPHAEEYSIEYSVGGNGRYLQPSYTFENSEELGNAYDEHLEMLDRSFPNTEIRTLTTETFEAGSYGGNITGSESIGSR